MFPSSLEPLISFKYTFFKTCCSDQYGGYNTSGLPVVPQAAVETIEVYLLCHRLQYELQLIILMYISIYVGLLEEAIILMYRLIGLNVVSQAPVWRL